jgi:hypothetical protein
MDHLCISVEQEHACRNKIVKERRPDLAGTDWIAVIRIKGGYARKLGHSEDYAAQVIIAVRTVEEIPAVGSQKISPGEGTE